MHHTRLVAVVVRPAEPFVLEAEGRAICRGGNRSLGAATAPGAMTRSDLIADLAAAAPYLRHADAEAIVVMIFDQIADALARGQRVELRDFGAFTVKHRAARVGRNPRTGAEVPVNEKAVPVFKAGGKLRQRVNPPPWRLEPNNQGRASPRRQP